MSKAKLLRRVTGGLCLVGALVMLAGGETQPPANASHLGFALYWLACLLLAVAAMVLAMLDLLAVRSEARRAQRDLFEETLVEIQKTPRPPRPQSAARRDKPGD